MYLSRVEERGEEWKTTKLKTLVLKTAGNTEDSVLEDRRGKREWYNRSGFKIAG